MKDRIRQVRLSQNLTQQEFADALGVLISTISKYERGKVRPTTEFFARLAERFDVNLNWLITGKGPMYAISDSELASLRQQIQKEFQLPAEEADLLVDELLRSQMTRDAIIKLLRAKRGNKAALADIKRIVQGMEMVLDTP